MVAFPTPLLGAYTDYQNFWITSVAGDNYDNGDVFSGVAWQELVASTSENWAGFTFTAIAQYSGVIQFAIGGVGSEVRFASLFMFGGNVQTSHHIPIPVPAGSRLSISYHHDRNSNRSFTCTIRPVRSVDVPQDPPFTKLEVGAFQFPLSVNDFATGLILDAGAVAATWTPWTELSYLAYTENILQGNSLPHQYKYLGFNVSPYGGGATANSGGFEAAYGPAASEVQIFSNTLAVNRTAYLNTLFDEIHWVPWNRPAGDRISVRWRSSSIDAGSREAKVLLYGLR